MGNTDLLSGPGDVDHERKWKPSSPEDRRDWAANEALPFLSLFKKFVEIHPEKTALTWFNDSGDQIQRFTYKEFDDKAKAVAALLLEDWKVERGSAVVLVYPPGLEFLVAFVACLYAGVIAVPVYPPNPNALSKDMPKMKRVVEDSGATVVLTTGKFMNVVRFSQLRLVTWPGKYWHTTDGVKVSSRSGAQFQPSVSDIAFLQYTSGSTADPKGVMVGHMNMAHNIMFVRRTLRLTENSRFFSWLPQYHDLGLIVAYLGTLSAGASGFYMSPLTFIRSPPLWLHLMSKHQITHTAAPNFALDLTCRKLKAETDEPLELDLSRLESLLNAAEPVREDSISRWNATLSPYGWHPSSMTPCYGLAEHVVGVVGWGTKVVHITEGEQQVRKLHSSGNLSTFPYDGRIAIVNPETLIPCPEGTEGEIWVRSQHVTLGYWKKPELSDETFKGTMAKGAPGSDDQEYLRTGDLGFIVEDQLFVTGRIKDLIIIRGKNYHPEDIEKTTEAAWENLRAGCIAAFSMPSSSSGNAQGAATAEELVAIVAEMKEGQSMSKADYRNATAKIRRAVVTTHGVFPAIVAIIPARTIPKTTSGKIRRGETRSKLAAGSFKVLNAACYREDSSTAEADAALLQSQHDADLPQDEINGGANGNGHLESAENSNLTVEDTVLRLIRIKRENVKETDSLVALGLTSMDGIDVFNLLKQKTGKKLSPEEVEVLTVADLRAVDKGLGLPDLAARVALNTGEVCVSSDTKQ